jgi:hypothetical protein
MCPSLSKIGISVILIIGLFLVACGEQTETPMPLDKGAPNTVTLSNGEVVYKLDGEWSFVFEATMNPKHEDIVKYHKMVIHLLESTWRKVPIICRQVMGHKR